MMETMKIEKLRLLKYSLVLTRSDASAAFGHPDQR
jgi:hypothetical protein